MRGKYSNTSPVTEKAIGETTRRVLHVLESMEGGGTARQIHAKLGGVPKGRLPLNLVFAQLVRLKASGVLRVRRVQGLTEFDYNHYEVAKISTPCEPDPSESPSEPSSPAQ